MSAPLAPTDTRDTQGASGDAGIAVAAARPLARNFSWVFGGNLVGAAAQWAVLMILAKLTSPAVVGQYALAVAVAAPVNLFANAQLRPILATDVRGEYRVGDYLGARLLTAAMTVLILWVVAGTGWLPWGAALALVLMSLDRAVVSVSDILYGVLDRQERMDRVGVALVVRGVLTVVAFTAGIVWGGLPGGLLGSLLVSIAMLIAYDAPQAARVLPAGPGRLVPLWHRAVLLRIARTALPLGVVTMIGSVGAQLPRYFLGQVGERELGIFAAVVYPVGLGGMLVSTMSYSVMPRLARYFAEGEIPAFRRLLLGLTGVSAALGGTGVLAALVAGGPLLSLIYTPEYGAYSGLFAWIMLAAAVGYVTAGWDTAMTAVRCFHVQLPLIVTVFAATLAVCVWGIPRLGLQGAAYAMLAGAVTHAVGGGWVVLRAARRRAQEASRR